jgi:hypothetical protein
VPPTAIADEAGLSIPSRTPLPPPRRPSITQAGFGPTRRAKAAQAREAEAWEQSLCTRVELTLSDRTVTMVAKPFHDRAAAAPEAKTANVSNATAITTNWSATAVVPYGSRGSPRSGRLRISMPDVEKVGVLSRL